MKMTEEGLALIRQFEGFRSHAYRCPAGVWTIGYGHTSQAGSPAVSPGLTIGEVEARSILAADVERFASEVRDCLRRELTDGQFSALVSFAYNVGIGNVRRSSALKAVNTGDFASVPRRLQLWVKADGKVLPGLVKRRAAEAALFVAAEHAEADPPARPSGATQGKPAFQSTTVLSALAAAAAALAAGPLGGLASLRWLSLLPMAVVLIAAAWIIIERLRKAREDGV